MSIVSCGSCGMQYNAAGYKPGVQFKCTQCGAMVVVAGAARGTGRMPGGPRRAAGGPVGGPGPYATNPYGPPQRKSNVGAMIGIGGGVAVAIGLIIVVIVASSGPSPAELQQQKITAENEERRKRTAAEDEKKRQKNALMTTTYDAALTLGNRIEELTRENNRPALEALFDWDAYAAYNAGLAAKDKQYLVTPLFSTGKYDWVDSERKDPATGEMKKEPLLKWQVQSLHTSTTLRTAVMDYIEKFCFNSPEVMWDRANTAKDTGSFGGMVAGGRTYMGKKIYLRIKGTGKVKEFWVGAPEGDANVRVINFVDESATSNVVNEIIKVEKKSGTSSDGGPGDDRGLGGGFDERKKREGGDTRRDPEAGEPGKEAPRGEQEIELPPLAKTNAKPTDARLENVLRSLVGGAHLAPAQRTTVVSSPVAERKAMLGALIDALIDAHKAGKRLEKHSLSAALYDLWKNHANHVGTWQESDMTYEADGNKQSNSEDPIKRWLKVYAEYK
jgi:hypothetical protein